MFEEVLYILVEWGLMREDVLHRRKIKKQEKQDGKKYPLRKYFFTPTNKLLFGLLILASIVGFTISVYHNKIVNPRKTIEEMTLIQKSANNWKDRMGSFPDKIEQLIGGRPYRKTWPFDAWGTAYLIDTRSDEFLVISAGPDKIHHTEDDLAGHFSD